MPVRWSRPSGGVTALRWRSWTPPTRPSRPAGSNAFCYLPAEQAREAAARADVTLPFGGVPVGVKELDHVAGWPATEACVVFADRIADHTSTLVSRLVEQGGAVLAGQTTASEFGGVNVTRTLLHGATGNPWDAARTPGGSSGGSAGPRWPAAWSRWPPAAMAAGPSASLAGFTGLVGLKATYGRIPRGPWLEVGNYTTTAGGLTRSVRDTARLFDVANGHDARDPASLPRVDGWEAGLGSHGRRARGPPGRRRGGLGRRGRVTGHVGEAGRRGRPSHRPCGPATRRGRGHDVASHGRRLVDQRDDQRRQRAGGPVAGLRRGPHPGDALWPRAH